MERIKTSFGNNLNCIWKELFTIIRILLKKIIGVNSIYREDNLFRGIYDILKLKIRQKKEEEDILKLKNKEKRRRRRK